MQKKYFSEDEFYTIDKVAKTHIPFTGYVIIDNGTAYSFATGEKLEVGSNYLSEVNLSDEYFDRILDEKLVLPHSIDECTFAPNDFLKKSVINKIIANLSDNNRYIFKNCIVPQNDFPLASEIPVLAPSRPVIELPAITGGSEAKFGPVDGWLWSDISYHYIQDISNKENWPEDIEGYSWNTDDIVDAIICPTDKNYKDGLSDKPENKLFAAFVANKTNFRLMNLYLCPDDILAPGKDPFKESITEEIIESELTARKFVEFSPENNGKNNLNLYTFDHIDPANTNSVKFKNITGITRAGDYMYITDSELNGVYKYDISKCLTNRGIVTNKIVLVDQLQGKGGLNDPFFFNNPSAISANDEIVAILDKDNLCVKVFDHFFNHKFTIKEGGFVRQTPVSVTICPYDFIYNNIEVKAGSIFVASQVASEISIDIFAGDSSYLFSRKVDYIQLIKELWYNPLNNQLSSSTAPIYCQEKLLKLEFSMTNSNFLYVVTTRRLIKLELSHFGTPIGIITYSYKMITDEELTWANTHQPWQAVQDFFNNFAKWEYAKSKIPIMNQVNKCFSITAIEGLDCDVILNITNNKLIMEHGKLQRVDNYTDNNLLYIDNITRKLTYAEVDATGKNNKPAEAEVGGSVVEYINVNGTPTPNKVDGKDSLITVQPVIYTVRRIPNAILFYKEPVIFKSSLTRTDIKLYSKEELAVIDDEEYYSQLTFNKILYRLLFNLQEIKKYIFGTFIAGYSIDNIMTYDNILVDYSIQDIASDSTNFFVGENEQTSLLLNRCFTNIYNAQLNILEKMQTIYSSSISYNLSTYKLI